MGTGGLEVELCPLSEGAIYASVTLCKLVTVYREDADVL